MEGSKRGSEVDPYARYADFEGPNEDLEERERLAQQKSRLKTYLTQTAPDVRIGSTSRGGKKPKNKNLILFKNPAVGGFFDKKFY